MAQQTEADFWKEDAERLNKLAKDANQAGIQAKTGPLVPPALNSDGSEKTAKKKE